MNRRTGTQHIPDILDCLAQLSNDEVPTPPKVARVMLDLLPAEVWSRPDYRWLDPCCKSGVFLREIASRLLVGLEAWEPDFERRREHIFRRMLYGTSLTEMTGIISRRSLYCSRDASGDYSVVRFATASGNLPFVPTAHTFNRDGKCSVCGAPAGLERGAKRENYAYSFIHGTYPTQEMSTMKFDVIVGNPPYQIGVDGNSRTRPVYQLFIEKAISLKPRYALFITPSRWFAGGLGLDDFRKRMLAHPHFKAIVDYPNAADCFPGVEIKGGVSYFLWDRTHSGPTHVTTRRNGTADSTAVRKLNAYDVFIRYNEAIPILEKVRAAREATLTDKVWAQKPFGLQSNYHGAAKPTGARTIPLYGTKRVTYIAENEITMNKALIALRKVLMSEGYNGGDGLPHRITGHPFAVAPRTACTQTYLVMGCFDTEEQADRYVLYLSTRFVRFLISLRKITQHCKPDTFAFVPDLSMDRTWTDEMLYERYELTQDEIAFIESQVKAMSPDEGDDE